MIKKVVRKHSNSDMCFVCGIENDLSLKAEFFEMEDGTLLGLATAGNIHQSYSGIVHGGVSASLLDEVIGRAISCSMPELKGMTLELNTKYKKPVPCGVPLIITGRVIDESEKVYTSEGEIILPDGTIAVTATGVYYKISNERLDAMGLKAHGLMLSTKDDDPAEIDIPVHALVANKN